MLDVSRTDIISSELMKFDQADRFIKLPIQSYMDLLGIEPNSSQKALINAINNPKYRFVCAALSRRQGKTYIANVIGQLVSLVPGSNILIMSPNYSLSQISFDLQRQLIKHFDLEVTKDNAKDKVIELSNGSTIRMGSVNQVDSTVGRSYDLIIFDEAALADFNFETQVGDFEQLDTSKMDVFAGLDVGYKDPTALCVIAYDWDEQKFYLIDEYMDAERTTEQHAIEINKMIHKYNIDYIYIDSAAQQTRFDFAQNYDISTINAKKSVLDGIGHTAGIIDNDFLHIDQRCSQALSCVDQYQWDPNPNLMREKPKHNMASHMADALRYALYTFETSAGTF